MKINSNALLSEKEAKFATAVTSGHPATTAAKIAGLSVGSADRYLHRPAVVGFLRAASAHLSRIMAKLDTDHRDAR